jgi:dihydroorotase
MHCHLCDPGFEHKENIETASLSALRGGFTSITCQPSTQPAIDNKVMVEYILSKSHTDADVHIFPYGSMTKKCMGKEIAEIGEMKLAGIVAISDGDIPIADADVMQKILTYSKMFDLPVITHCEDVALSNGSIVNEGAVSTLLGLKGAPKSAEEIMVARNVLLAGNTDAHIHIAQVSTKGSVDIIRQAKKYGIKVTAETSPQYFTLTEKALLNYNTLAKVNPPLRTQEDVEAVIEGLKDGTIDVISSGHMPTTWESKQKEFEKSKQGISSFETAFSLCYTHLVANNILSIQELVKKITLHPAEILALNKGVIKQGADADLVVVDPKEVFTVDAAEFASKAKFSPYNKTPLKGKVLYTIVKGKWFL